jgi:hypothetical protein
MDVAETQPLLDIFQCVMSKFPVKYLGIPLHHVKYLGIPLHHDRLRREDLEPLIENILKRITGWRGKLLSCCQKNSYPSLFS